MEFDDQEIASVLPISRRIRRKEIAVLLFQMRRYQVALAEQLNRITYGDYVRKDELEALITKVIIPVMAPYSEKLEALERRVEQPLRFLVPIIQTVIAGALVALVALLISGAAK